MTHYQSRGAGPGAPGYDAWSSALVDVLLPPLPEARVGTPVLLSCDDETVAVAAATLGLDTDNPAADFGRCVEARFHIALDGSPERVRRDTATFRARPRAPDVVPPFLGVCCSLVLAASRMTSDEGMRAHNYYERLWHVLGRQPARRGPYDFAYVPWLFKYLAQWLDDDLGGARGRLLIAEGGPKHVGAAINQCLFRERDKEHLAAFFADRVGSRRHELDLLRLLQVSSDRHRLTKRAQQALGTRELHELARAALATAFETWDGSRPDPRGGRSWLASLHLAVNRGLRLTLAAADAPAGLELGGGRLLNDPARDRFALGAAELSELRTRGLRWGQAHANGIYLPPAGDTLIFEVREDTGLVWVSTPAADQVFVLTREGNLQRRLAAYTARLVGASSLPRGWNLYERVPISQLPTTVAASPASRPPVALTGGLRIGQRQYLTGHALRVEAGDVDEALTVRVDGDDLTALAACDDLQLDLAVGEHIVEAGDGLISWTIRMLDSNPTRPAYGQLAYPLTDRGARAGAMAACEGVWVRGALLSEPYAGDIPLMLRAREVVVIDAAGRSQTLRAPDPPRWLGDVGLDAAGVRWEAQLDPYAIWVLTGQQAVAIRPQVPPMLDATARAAIEVLCQRSKPRVRSLHRRDREAAGDAFLEMATLPQDGPA